MGFVFDGWVYGHFFTGTVNYNGSHIEILLHDACQKNLSGISDWSLLLRMSLESYVTTDGQSATLSWNKAPIWGLRPDFYYCQSCVFVDVGRTDERTRHSTDRPVGLPFYNWHEARIEVAKSDS
jgi:hypothetical protein